MTRELQQSLMHVRMVPFDSLAERLYRLVRQTAKELGRRANLDIIGGQIEIDRSVLEGDDRAPGHLVRNAVAHGVAARKCRRAAGKPRSARSPSRSPTKATTSSSSSATTAPASTSPHPARPSPPACSAPTKTPTTRLTNLIFVPGFSTASLSSLAGRGVGMDVVKSETAAVGGRISVATDPGQGTTFRILPLTWRSPRPCWCAPASAPRRSLVDGRPGARTQGLGPRRDPQQQGTGWLGEPATATRRACSATSNPSPGRPLQLGAAAARRQRDPGPPRGTACAATRKVVVKNAGPQYARMVGFSGATVLGDGEIVLILNPVALAGQPRRRPTTAGAADGRLGPASPR